MFLADHIFYDVFRRQMVNPKFETISKDAANAISPYCNKYDADLILKKLVEYIGFVDVIVQVEEKSYTYCGAESFKGNNITYVPNEVITVIFYFPYKDFVKAIHPLAARLTGDLQKEMIEEFCTACLVKSANSMNEFSTPYKLITFYGRKA